MSLISRETINRAAYAKFAVPWLVSYERLNSDAQKQPRYMVKVLSLRDPRSSHVILVSLGC